MKKKIVIDARMINDSGIGTYLKNILPFFTDNFNTVLLGNKSEIEALFTKKKIQVINFEAKIYSLKEQLLFPFIIPKSDIFWSPHYNSPIFPIKSSKRITTIHDVNHLDFKKGFNMLKRIYSKILISNSVKKSNKIITVSNFSKNQLSKHFDNCIEKIEVIYGGVSESFFKRNDSHDLELPEKYFLFVGNVKPHKNLITLLKAYAILPKAIQKHYKLVILGKKEGFITPDKDVFKFIDQHKLIENIVFTGYLPDKSVPFVYQNAELFIFPSLYEGFGLPLIEAMASKTFVLSSNFASLPEVGKDKVLYFNPESENNLKDMILGYFEIKNKKEFLENGFEYAKTFVWSKAIEKHKELFNKL